MVGSGWKLWVEVLAAVVRWIWRGLDRARRFVWNLAFLALILGGAAAWWFSGPPALQDKTVLVLDLSGPLVEQFSGSSREAVLSQLQDGDRQQVRLRDVLAALETAAQDSRIASVLLLLEDLSGGGLQAQREVAAALERFKASGKPVVAWGTGYDQRQYYLAAHANEVYLHPMGSVMIQGYGRLRNYYRDALERLGVSANVVRVGKYKNAAEPYFASGPSKETEESDAALYNALWSLYTQGVEKARHLPAGAVAAAIEGLPASLQAVGGDAAQWSVQTKFVDGLKTRDEMRKWLIERGAEDAQHKSFRQVRFQDYVAQLKPVRGGDAVAVIVAEGEIGDGVAPSGRIGGKSTAELVRKAREDESVKALVLRVNSPGGSALGSELIRRELEITRAAGKPVVVSMGDVAASGGYWVSLAADQVWADAATITGSIGVFGMLPTAERLMDKVSVHAAGAGTTWLTHAYDPRKPLDPRFASLVQASIGRVYSDFIAKAAEARKLTPGQIDAVAQGRVWSGAQAQARGLIDRTGSWDDAVRAAASLAKLGERPRVQWMEREPGRWDRLLGWFKSAALQAFQSEAVSLISSSDRMAWEVMQAVPDGAATRDAHQDLAWLHQVLQQRQPFSAVVHCLCTAQP